MRLDLEQKFIKQFVLKAKQDRCLGFVESPKRRGVFLEMLYRGQVLDKRLFQELWGSIHESDATHNKAHSATNGDKCYIISVRAKLDGQEMSLNEAIKEVAGREGTLLLFGDGAGVCYDGETL